MKSKFEYLKMIPERNPQVVASAKANFLRQAAALKANQHQNGWINNLFPFISINVDFPKLRPIVAVLLVIIILFGGSAATVYAAQDSLPDQPLYKVKTWSEDLLLAVTRSPQNQLEHNLNFADRRILEIAGMLAADTSIPQQVQTRLQAELDQALELAAGMDDQQMIMELERIGVRAKVQLQMMSMLMAGDTNSPDPVLAMVRSSLQQQLELTAQGMSDTQGFRMQYQNQYRNIDPTPLQIQGSVTIDSKYSITNTPMHSEPIYSKTSTPLPTGTIYSKTSTPTPPGKKFYGTSTGTSNGKKNDPTGTPKQSGNEQKTPTQDKGKKP
ncbi:MAG: DUF5667 domain-containing protein [Chloroflexota bacterium]